MLYILCLSEKITFLSFFLFYSRVVVLVAIMVYIHFILFFIIHSSSFSSSPVTNNFTLVIFLPHVCLLFIDVFCFFSLASCQYDLYSSQGEQSAFCASCVLWPSSSHKPQRVCNDSSTIGAHRYRSCSDETHFLWVAWRTGNPFLNFKFQWTWLQRD